MATGADFLFIDGDGVMYHAKSIKATKIARLVYKNRILDDDDGMLTINCSVAEPVYLGPEEGFMYNKEIK